jgi:sortase A
MNKYYYAKSTNRSKRIYIRYFGLLLSLFGIIILSYFSFPVATSYILLQHAEAAQSITAPIPQSHLLTSTRIQDILASTINAVSQVDYTDAKTWFPSFEVSPVTPTVKSYTLSIPKLQINDAVVSTQDYNVGSHLVNYGGTAVPPDKGNAVIFGHSTLPQLYSPGNYKTIFAKLHMIEVGDTIIATVAGVDYTYKITQIQIVSPSDFAPLMQRYDQSYLTVITCTPPGTTWERLVVKAVLEKT